MGNRVGYQPKYDQSWALVIGINKYQYVGTLGYACNDANAIADQLINRFQFPKNNVTVLRDEYATREAVLRSFLSFATNAGPDDRVVVFYAGHGCTQPSRRGEVGYLIPVDGKSNELVSLIRWDELTRNADLIPAKHVLFIMDACYGGLAHTRALRPGSARFVGDMLSRYSRQVLTAGKADEEVADSGGPRPGNSVFTGHLLEGLEGACLTTDGVLSANTLMAYVYDRVGKDPYSRQTPHHGHIDGDGDFMFTFPAEKFVEAGEPQDVLVQIPSNLQTSEEAAEPESKLDELKEYLSEAKHRIRLDDLVTREMRAVHERLSDQSFPPQTKVTATNIAERLVKYENELSDLLKMTVVLGRWANAQQQSALENIVGALADRNELRSGKTMWLAMRWYPLMLVLYHGGIGAIAGRDYRNLRTLFTTEVRSYRADKPTVTAIESTVEAMLEIDRMGGFKTMPEHSQMYVPRSEYVFKRIQATIEDTLSLGTRYERFYDSFEILYALSFADLKDDLHWGPPGRFAWKYASERTRENPFLELIEEAKRERDMWPPLQAGLFRGSYARFDEVATAYRARLDKLNWF